MAIPTARLRSMIAAKTIAKYRVSSKMRACVSHTYQSDVDMGQNKIQVPIWTGVAGSGAEPAGDSDLDEPTTNVKLTENANRDAVWPTARKPGIRMVDVELKATSLQSDEINWLDEHTVPLSWVESVRSDQGTAIRQDVDKDIYTEVINGIPEANVLTPGEIGVPGDLSWSKAKASFAVTNVETLTQFGMAIDAMFEAYTEAMTDIGAMDGEGAMAEFFAHMNIKTWNLYARYLRVQRIAPELSLETLRDNTALGAGMAVMVRNSIRILTNRQVTLPAPAGGPAEDDHLPIITFQASSCAEMADGPGVTGLISPSANQTGPHWRLNQAASLAVKKVDPRTVYQAAALVVA